MPLEVTSVQVSVDPFIFSWDRKSRTVNIFALQRRAYKLQAALSDFSHKRKVTKSRFTTFLFQESFFCFLFSLMFVLRTGLCQLGHDSS